MSPIAETSLLFRILAQNETEAGLSSARSSFAGFGSVLSGILGSEAVNGVGEFLKSSVDAAEEAQVAINLTAAAIKSTGAVAGVSAEQVHELADSIAQTAGVMPDVVQAAANMVLRFSNIRDVGTAHIFDETTQAAVDMAAALGGGVPTADAVTAQALKLGKALQDPVAGLSALSRVGLKFTADQTAQITAMEKANNVLGAQQVILDAVAKKFGGSAAAVSTPLQKLGIQFQLIKEQIGQTLLPILTQFATRLLSLVNPALAVGRAVVGFLGAHWQILASVGAAILTVVTGMKLWEIATAGVRLMWIALDTVVFMNPIVAVVLGIVAVVTYLMIRFAAVRNVVADVIQFCMRVLGDLAQFIVNTVVGSVEYLLKALGSIPLIGGPFKQAAESVDAFRKTVDGAISAVQNLNVAAGINNVGNFFKDTFSMPSFPSSGAGSVAAAIAPSITGAAPKIASAVKDLAANTAKALADFKNGIVQSFGALGSVISNQLAGPTGAFTIGAALDAQLAKAKAFMANIAALRARGLNTTSLNELINAGPDQGGAAAAALAQATNAQLSGVNRDEAALNKLGNQFATTQANAEFGSAKAVAANKVQLTIDLTGVSNDALVTALRTAIRKKGGNVQTVLGK